MSTTRYLLGVNAVPPIKPTVKFRSTSLSVVEGNNISINVDASANIGQPITVNYSVSAGLPPGGDYSLVPANSVTIPAGSTTTTIAVNTTHNPSVTGARNFTLHLDSVSTNATPDTVNQNITVTIADADTPTVSFAQSALTISEAGTTGQATLNINPVSPSPISVSFTIGGTATQGTDYTMQTSSPFTIAANTPTATINYSVIDDGIYEQSETIVFTLTGPAGQIANTVHTVTIQDNEPTPKVQFGAPTPNSNAVGTPTASSSSWNEGASFTLPVILTTPSSKVITVAVQAIILGTGTQYATTSDFSLNTTSLTFAAGSTTPSTPLNVTISNDSAIEQVEQFQIRINSATPTSLNGGADVDPNANAHNISIYSTNKPTVTVQTPLSPIPSTTATQSLNQGTTLQNAFYVVANAAVTAPVVVVLTPRPANGSDVTATFGTDYTLAGQNTGTPTVTIPSGQQSASVSFGANPIQSGTTPDLQAKIDISLATDSTTQGAAQIGTQTLESVTIVNTKPAVLFWGDKTSTPSTNASVGTTATLTASAGTIPVRLALSKTCLVDIVVAIQFVYNSQFTGSPTLLAQTHVVNGQVTIVAGTRQTDFNITLPPGHPDWINQSFIARMSIVSGGNAANTPVPADNRGNTDYTVTTHWTNPVLSVLPTDSAGSPVLASSTRTFKAVHGQYSGNCGGIDIIAHNDPAQTCSQDTNTPTFQLSFAVTYDIFVFWAMSDTGNGLTNLFYPGVPGQPPSSVNSYNGPYDSGGDWRAGNAVYANTWPMRIPAGSTTKVLGVSRNHGPQNIRVTVRTANVTSDRDSGGNATKAVAASLNSSHYYTDITT